jgi:undecaprenyl-diphosphatase
MMTYFDAFILAIVEGITEYLPVSSTAHITLTAQQIGVQTQEAFFITFNVIIQMAPIFAVMLIFKDKLLASIELWKRLIIAFIPVGVVGFLLADFIDQLFNISLIPLWMFLTGIFFIIIEYFHKDELILDKDISECSYKQALSIGIFQVFSLIPGISRSGSTILGAMIVGFKREAAMSFSFLLAIPTMGAASGYTLLKEYHSFDFTQIELLIVGFIVSFIVGYIAVKLLLNLIAKFSFVPFGIYLIITAFIFQFII